MEEFKYKCIICGKPCKYPMCLCTDCCKKGGQERDDYMRYLGYEVKEEKNV